MSNQVLNVDISVDTEIKDPNGTEEVISRQEKGSYIQRGSLHLIKYKEEMEEVGVVHTTVIITGEKITLKREGPVKMHQVFRIGANTESIYRHPYGQFRMETRTNRMEYYKGEGNRSGKIFIQYDVVLNEDEPREHTLEMKFKEEDA
ncbi:DUF1934 domain-containing protein [Alkalibacillus haloalkaliphilus]|uniref:DUF1934 domain-containing protein n=1 Tax=Alkalibacillus haloalkaliphilus TaxID=94136 RepID=UPI0029357692|nr:DUF1934 domain-containing protein [Alkalibacillus haloalkaliphilus]MDV2583140.1 DUF1934 domain-containing protein [Alkalibacillus haloalkaliphilus]